MTDQQTPEANIPTEPAADPALATALPTALPPRSAFRRHRVTIAVTAGALALGLLGGTGLTLAATAASVGSTTSTTTTTQPAVGPTTMQQPNSGIYRVPGQSSTTTTPAVAASADQQVGVVTILTDVQYGAGAAAGTGMVLTSEGIVLTNNHVIEGSTNIQVTVESTGETYAAKLVGSDAANDVAVLQLVDSSGDDVNGLTPVTLDEDATSIGDAVTGIGNAEGTGDLVAAAGEITATDSEITVSDEITGAAKTLTGLIEISADVVSGDSGGPLLDAEGEVTGVVTAASSGPSDVTGFAIPIDTALDVVSQILAGNESGTVTLGLPAFLGITVGSASASAGAATTGTGAVVAGVIDGLPAASAGLVAGDTILSIDGVAVAGYDSLAAIIGGYQPGDTVTLGFTDASGATGSVTLTLTEGPAE